jgi:hypothetical protein
MQNASARWHAAARNVTAELENTKEAFEIIMFSVCLTTTLVSCLLFSKKFRTKLCCYHPLNEIRDNEGTQNDDDVVDLAAEPAEKHQENIFLQSIIYSAPSTDADDTVMVCQHLPNQTVQTI